MLYQYNALGQMNGMAHYQPGDPDVLLAEYSDITYDAAGRRTGFSAQIAALPDYSGSYEFTYNAKGELTGEEFTPDDELLPPAERDYLYNAAGNITNFNGTERRYNGANQLTQEWVNGQWVIVVEYDDRGNPIEYRGHELEFNQGNHLTAFDESVTAGYFNDGRRIWKEVNGQRVFFIYDGDTLIGEVDEYGNPTAVNTIGATGLVSRLQGGSIGAAVFYLFDPLGNVLHRLNNQGTVISSDIYDAWGHREYTDDLTDDPYGYKGQYGYYTDHETGLILCTQRYYDPQTGRWLTKDPIGHEGGVNLYGYCSNDAVNMIDPSGLAQDIMAAGNRTEYLNRYRALVNQYKPNIEIQKALEYAIMMANKEVNPVLFYYKQATQENNRAIILSSSIGVVAGGVLSFCTGGSTIVYAASSAAILSGAIGTYYSLANERIGDKEMRYEIHNWENEAAYNFGVYFKNNCKNAQNFYNAKAQLDAEYDFSKITMSSNLFLGTKEELNNCLIWNISHDTSDRLIKGIHFPTQ